MCFVEFSGGWIRIGEVRFKQEALPAGVDLLYFLQMKEVSPRAPAIQATSVCTSVINLESDAEKLLSDMGDTTRYEIRRAEKRDGLAYRFEHAPKPALIREFAEFFAAFAARMGIGHASLLALDTYARSGRLDISRVAAADGTTLGWHVHFIGDGRVRLLHSASLRCEREEKEAQALVSRANRWHHWRDILRFRELGLREFDFGGIYTGSEDQHQLRIAAFKKSFGGQLELGYNFELPLTLKGRIYSSVKRLAGKRP